MKNQKAEDSAAVPNHVTLTIEKGNTGKFDFSGATITIPLSKVIKLAEGNGFEGEVRSLLGALDKHPLFGNFAEKGQTRPANYERGAMDYTEERAEVVRQLIAAGTDLTGHIAVTVTPYLPSSLIVTAKDSIKKKVNTESSLVKLATAAGYEFSDWKSLTVDNVDFVKAVAALHASI
jgi:hypothetical protein